MANIKSAQKRAKQAVASRLHNMQLRARLRTYIKKVIKAADSGEDQQEIASLYQKAVSVIDSSANKKLIHRNKAARHKSRLNKLIRRASEAQA